MKTPLIQTSLRRNRQSGFTMIEIALALAIIAIGVVAILGIMPSMLKLNRASVDSTELALSAQQIFERSFTFHDRPSALQDFMDVQTSDFPAAVTNSAFTATSKFSYYVSTNVWGLSGTPQAFVTPFKGGSSPAGSPLLTTIRLRFAWPPNAPPQNQESFTFVTEVGASRNIAMGAPPP